MTRLFALSILVFLLACQRQKTEDKIQGVWVFDSKINALYINNSHGYSGFQRPIVYDFLENGAMVINKYPYNSINAHWSINSDSLLTIDSTNYTIHILNHDSLVLLDYNTADTFWLTYKRPKEVRIDYSKSEIEKILLSNNWSIEDTVHQKWLGNFEYFDNNTMVYRYKIFNRALNDTVYNLQLETWGVAKYKDYYFLYNYYDFMHVNGNMNRICQIVDINGDSYTTVGFEFDNKETKFNIKATPSDIKHLINKLKGNWTSINSIDKTYGAFYHPRRENKNKRVAFYEGGLHLSIGDKSLSLKLDTLKPIDYSWQLGKEGKTLIYEYTIDEPGREGIHVDFANIIELTDTTMKVRLFNNNFYTGVKFPSSYHLNMIQEFKRTEGFGGEIIVKK